MTSIDSAPSLSRFHYTRAVLYRAIAFLIGAPSNGRTRGIAHRILVTCPAHAVKEELERALECDMHLADTAWLDFPCAMGSPIRTEAFRFVGRVEDHGQGSEAEVLSALAERGARAIQQHNIAEAARVAELQHALLTNHAAECLLRVSTALESRASDYAQHLGKAIALMIDCDCRLLG